MKDTKHIFIEILKVRAKCTVADIKEKQLALPKPSTMHITLKKTNGKDTNNNK